MTKGGKGSGFSGGGSSSNRTPEAAAAISNPNYASSRPYRVNCQRCIYAYEMNMRDPEHVYEALPNYEKRDDTFYHGGWAHVGDGQKFVSVGSRSRAKVEANLNAKAAEWGDGSRGIVYVAWTHGRSAHVFNFSRNNGKTEYFDAQTGRKVNISEYLSEAKPTKTLISRLDNLQLDQSKLMQAVKRVK